MLSMPTMCSCLFSVRSLFAKWQPMKPAMPVMRIAVFLNFIFLFQFVSNKIYRRRTWLVKILCDLLKLSLLQKNIELLLSVLVFQCCMFWSINFTIANGSWFIHGRVPSVSSKNLLKHTPKSFSSKSDIST